jgi:pilus assembly protein Flp/PilA
VSRGSLGHQAEFIKIRIKAIPFGTPRLADNETQAAIVHRPTIQTEPKGKKMTNLLKRFSNDESGATAIEYGLIAGLISVVIIAAVTLIGLDLQGIFQYIADTLVVPA